MISLQRGTPLGKKSSPEALSFAAESGIRGVLGQKGRERGQMQSVGQSSNQREKSMHLFATEEGDKWVCIHCRLSEKEMLSEKEWQWIFDRDDQTLRCTLCGHPDFDYDD
jgi:hypothetical protein